jgi:hypothetical protein
MTIYIKGETGATLGPDRVEFGSTLKAAQGKVDYKVLADDMLSWLAETQSLNAGETIIPDIGQKVSLYLDEVRIFHGHVVDTELVPYGVRVGVYGPHWWLRRQDVTSTQDDDEGTPGERPTVQFLTGDLDSHIDALIDSANEVFGFPVWVGDIDAMYAIPTVSYSLTSFAGVLAKLIEWCPDAVPWWDHSAEAGTVESATSTTVELDSSASAVNDVYNGLEIELRDGAGEGETRVISDYDGATKTATISPAWTATPSNGDGYVLEIPCRLNVTRRDNAATRTHDLAAGEILDGLSFRPRVEYQTAQVSLPYVDRNPTTGRARWQIQEAGTFAKGKRQIVPVSGPEIADFLPFDDFDNYALTLANPAAELDAFLFARDTQLSTAKTAGLGSALDAGGVTFSYATNTNQLPTANAASYTVPGPAFLAADGTAVSTVGKRLITGERPPDWVLNDLGYTIEEVTISGFYGWEFIHQTVVSGSSTTHAIPEWMFALGWDLFGNNQGGFKGTSFSNYTSRDVYGKSYQVQAYLIDTTTAATLYKPWAYDFLNPPAGLAVDLLAASDWLPWEGSIPWQLAELSVIQPLGEKHHVAGILTSAASAGALPRAYALDLQTHVARVECGVPSRADYRTLVGRTQRNPQDNIVRL